MASEQCQSTTRLPSSITFTGTGGGNSFLMLSKACPAAQGISGDQPVIAYCRIGERSSLTWFALKYLLGFQNVKNYDGSWTEWGNLVGAQVEKP